MASSVEVIPAEAEHLERMGAAMGAAFQDEPNFAYILEDPEKRRRALPWFFGRFAARLGFMYGQVHTTRDAQGGAIWLAPGKAVGAPAALRAGMLSMPRRFGWKGMKRSMEVSRHIDRMRKESAPDRHWYLLALGVGPSAQGRGIGSALVRPVLAQSDAEGMPCYLETFSERNVAFYRRLDFEVSREEELRPAGIRFWGMTRMPISEQRGE